MTATETLAPIAIVDDLTVGIESAEARFGGWNGRSIRVQFAISVLHDNVLRAPGDEAVFAASFQPGVALDGKAIHQWMGPDASHVARLVTIGAIAGFPSARQRVSREAAISAERQVDLSEGQDPDGEGLDLPSLQPRTHEQKRQELEGLLRGGPAAMVARERTEVQDAVKEMAKATADSVKGLTDVMKDFVAAAVVAQAPAVVAVPVPVATPAKASRGRVVEATTEATTDELGDLEV